MVVSSIGADHDFVKEMAGRNPYTPTKKISFFLGPGGGYIRTLFCPAARKRLFFCDASTL